MFNPHLFKRIAPFRKRPLRLGLLRFSRFRLFRSTNGRTARSRRVLALLAVLGCMLTALPAQGAERIQFFFGPMFSRLTIYHFK